MERNKILIIITILWLTVGIAACSDANNAARAAWGKPHHIRQYSGGEVIGEWDSTGAVENDSQSDGYYFEDAKTNRLVTVTGTVQIEVNR